LSDAIKFSSVYVLSFSHLKSKFRNSSLGFVR